MPSLFKQSSVEVLRHRQDEVDREIASLVRFRERIERRIALIIGRGSARP